MQTWYAYVEETLRQRNELTGLWPTHAELLRVLDRLRGHRVPLVAAPLPRGVLDRFAAAPGQARTHVSPNRVRRVYPYRPRTHRERHLLIRRVGRRVGRVLLLGSASLGPLVHAGVGAVLRGDLLLSDVDARHSGRLLARVAVDHP
jgi:hypothetical protein